jgi:hypothetical protein
LFSKLEDIREMAHNDYTSAPIHQYINSKTTPIPVSFKKYWVLPHSGGLHK